MEESDKAIRLARILAQAGNTFGDIARGLNWLRSKQQRLGGAAPLSLVGTEQGAHLVEEQLVQIDERLVAAVRRRVGGRLRATAQGRKRTGRSDEFSGGETKTAGAGAEWYRPRDPDADSPALRHVNADG